MVEYRTYILGDTGVYWFVFRTDKKPDYVVLERAREQEGLLVSGLQEIKGQFEEFRPTYDAIVDSFRVTEPVTGNPSGRYFSGQKARSH